jgi:hypothetical protein
LGREENEMLAVLLTIVSGDGLSTPFCARAGGQPIDVGGHAAPLLADFDGDGSEDLLVGQNRGGMLLLHRNHGRCGAPQFEEGEVVLAGGAPASVAPG